MKISLDNVGQLDSYVLETKDRTTKDFSGSDIENALEEMLDDTKFYVTLASPEAQNNVRAVSAKSTKKGVDVRLGIEEKKNYIVHKICTSEECFDIFLDFFEGTAPDLKDFTPVK